MAVLVYEIQGNNIGLANAVNDSISLLQNLQKTASGINLGGGNVKGLSSAIIDANNQALNLKKTTDSTNLSFKDQAAIAALDTLGRKLLVIKGNSNLFGDSIKSQQTELAAYQQALNKLLSAGFEPLSKDALALKTNIDSLTASIAAQNDLLNKPVRRTIISDSVSEAAAANNGQVSGTTFAGTGSEALIRDLNKDLAAGTITAEEYNAAIKQIGVSQAQFAASTGKANVSLAEEEGLLSGLNAELKLLKTARLQIVNPADLAKQNAIIQELEASIAQFGNVGKAGFDSAGVAIKGFGKEAEQAASGGLGGMGKGLTSAYGSLRQLAYILPGIGIAGIFNLAFEAISKATESLDLFNQKTSVAEKNLANLNEVSINAGKQFGEQSTNLRILYQATQDVNNSEHDRVLAARELQKEFPDTFKNLSTEAILNGEASNSYKQLTADILDNAKARAALTKIQELAGKQLVDDIQIQKIQNAQFNESQRVIKQYAAVLAEGDVAQGRAKLSPSKALQIASDPTQNGFLNAIKQRADAAKKLQDQDKKDLQAQIDFLTKFAGGNNAIAKALAVKDTPKDKTTSNAFLDLNKQIDDLLAKTQNLAQASGLTGYAAAVQKITATYESLNRQVDEFNKKVGADVKSGRLTKAQGASLLAKSANVASALPSNQSKELSDAAIAEANRVATEIQRINDEFGVKAEQSRGKEIAAVSALADKEIAKAQSSALTRAEIEANYQKAIANGKGNQGQLQDAETLRDAEIQQAQNAADEVVAIQNGKVAAIKAINEKYIQLENDLWDKISLIDGQAQAEIGNKTEVETGKIIKEWESRRDAANKYYDELIKISKSDAINAIPGNITGFNISGLLTNLQRAKTNTSITNAETADVNLAQNKNLLSGLDQATTGFVGDFLNGLENANSEVGANFQSVFAGIAQSFQKTISNVAISGISTLLKDKLEQGIKDGTIHLSGILQGIIGAAGVAGSVISGITPKTSTIGQGLGGALSGAASGALIGSVFGPAGTIAGGVIGGAIGLIGGIFSSSKARKELAQKQLAEAQQQTALLKASLAYTSSIIGRMTTAGNITGVDVSATGTLVATVSGKDLQFVLDRNGR